MKRKKLVLCLALEAAGLLALSLLTARLPALFSSAAAFPFEQIALGLRALAGTGALGNDATLALWAGLSLFPLVPALTGGGRSRGERLALGLLALTLALALYAMVNPVVFLPLPSMAADETRSVVYAVFGGCVWSAAILWAVLRLIRLLRTGDRAVLLSHARGLLYALCVLFTGRAALSAGSSLAALGEELGAWDRVFALLRFLWAIALCLLDLGALLAALDLLDAVTPPELSGVDGAAERLCRVCSVALGVSTALCAVFNLLQLLFMPRLSSIVVTVEIPAASIAFLTAALLLTRLLEENQRLRHDNDLLI